MPTRLGTFTNLVVLGNDLCALRGRWDQAVALNDVPPATVWIRAAANDKAHRMLRESFTSLDRVCVLFAPANVCERAGTEEFFSHRSKRLTFELSCPRMQVL